MSKDFARLDLTAIEDTLCNCIPAEHVQRPISSNAEVANHLLRTSATRSMDRSLQELRTQTGLMGDTERLLYSLAVSDVRALLRVERQLRQVRDGQDPGNYIAPDASHAHASSTQPARGILPYHRTDAGFDRREIPDRHLVPAGVMSDWFKLGSGLESGRAALSKDARTLSLRYLVLDTELTSLDHRTNRLLCVGAVALPGPSIRLGEQFYRVVNPQARFRPTAS